MNTEIVETFSGKFFPKEECKKIKGNWYKIGDPKIIDSGECYLIGERYYRDTDFISYDHAIKRYVIYTKNMTYGVVEIEEDNETLVFGFYSQINLVNKGLNIIDKEGNISPLMNYDIVRNSLNYLESNTSLDGVFVHRSIIKTKEIFEKFSNCNNIKQSLPYNCSPYMIRRQCNLFKRNISNLKITNKVKEYAKFLKHYTFGAEFETSKGIIPSYVLDNYGIIPLRDGSIEGLEYVTIPHGGEVGLQALLNTIKELEKRTIFDDKECSFHLHIGGMPRTISYITALFKILDIIEHDIFKLFPLYKETNYRVKRKSYTKPLPKSLYRSLDSKISNEKELLSNFKKIFLYLSMGKDFEDFNCDLSEISTHPNDGDNNRKWQVDTRYHWINVIPLIFGNKETIEFRIHTPSYDKNKIINFLYLCIGIIEFVKINEDEILKDSSAFSNVLLTDIVTVFENNSLMSELHSYLGKRRREVHELTISNGIYFKEEDIIYNSNYIKWGDSINNAINENVTIGLQHIPQKVSLTSSTNIDIDWAGGVSVSQIRSMASQLLEEYSHIEIPSNTEESVF